MRTEPLREHRLLSTIRGLCGVKRLGNAGQGPPWQIAGRKEGMSWGWRTYAQGQDGFQFEDGQSFLEGRGVEAVAFGRQADALQNSIVLLFP